MIGSIRAELAKVWTTRLWIGLAAGGLLLSAFGAVALVIFGESPEAAATGLQPVRTLSDVEFLVFGGAVMSAMTMVLGATMATAEFRYGTASLTALAVPNRIRTLTAKMVAAAPIGLVLGIAAGLVPLLVAGIAFAVRGDAMPFGSVLLVDVGYVALQCAFTSVVTVGVGQIVRSQLVAILGLLGWTLIAEQIAVALLPGLAKWTPFAGAQNAFGAAQDSLISRPIGALLMVAYVVAVWSVAVWLDRRRDI